MEQRLHAGVTTCAHRSHCPCSSMAEHCLGKAAVLGSIPSLGSGSLWREVGFRKGYPSQALVRFRRLRLGVFV